MQQRCSKCQRRVIFELVGVGFGVGEGFFKLVAVGVVGFGICFLLTMEGEAGGQLAAGARWWEVEGRWGWWWVCWRCGDYVEGWVAGDVLQTVLSA